MNQSIQTAPNYSANPTVIPAKAGIQGRSKNPHSLRERARVRVTMKIFLQPIYNDRKPPSDI